MSAKSDLIIRDLLSMIDREPLAAISQHALDQMVRLTGSAVGFFATLDNSGRCVTSLLVSPTRMLPSGSSSLRSEPLEPAAYWFDCAARREAVVRNGGVPFTAPDGAAAGSLSRDLTVPLFDGDRLTALIGVADRAGNYSTADAAFASELAAGLQRVLVRKRLHDRLQDEAPGGLIT